VGEKLRGFSMKRESFLDTSFEHVFFNTDEARPAKVFPTFE